MPLTMLTAACQWCHGDLEWTQARGWYHVAGGGLYVQKCLGCGWKGAPYPSVTTCPKCKRKGKYIVDDHCALPTPKVKP